MKKKILATLIILTAVVAAAVTIYKKNEERKPEFEIVSTIKNSFEDHEDVMISVIVNSKDYDEESMMNKVYAHYIGLNGEPEELCIKLFDGKEGYESGTVNIDKIYYKE